MENMKRKNVTLLHFFKKKSKVETESDSTNLEHRLKVSVPVVSESEPVPSSSASENVSHNGDASVLGAVQCDFEVGEERDPSKGCEKARILLSVGVGPYQPLLDFPQTNGRKFRSAWYSEFDWLEYSVERNSAFCFNCRAFGHNVAKSEESFTKCGISNWKKAVEKFKKHQASEAHKLCTTRVVEFCNSRQHGTIANLLDTQRGKIVTENRQYLEAIISSILFCARQCIALRGHRENDASENRGNLMELLTLRSQDNEMLLRFFVNKEKTFRYVSPDYQNQFLDIMSNQVLGQIINNVKSAGIFSVIMDETQDLRRHEQVSLVLRYCDHELNVHESFVGFYRTDSTDGESLCVLLKEKLKTFGLNLQDVRGQCYDGAAAMRGQYSGVAKRILDENALAMYIHCYAHVLNLCIVDVSSEVMAVRNMFGVLNKLYTFIDASSKRHSVFERIQKESSQSSTLKPLCDTRWNCRVAAVRAALKNFSSIVETLEAIAESDKVSGPEAHSLVKCTADFLFLFPLKLMRIVLEHVNQLSQHLQTKDANFSSVILMVQGTLSVLKSLRNDEQFLELWNDTEQLAKKENCSPAVIPRRRTVPAKFGGGPSSANCETPADFYRQSIYFPVLDILINEINNRFKENDLELLHALRCVLSSKQANREYITLICNTYKVPESELIAELNVFNHLCENSNTNDDFNSRFSIFCTQKLFESFPHLNMVFKILLTIPMSSASCERSFSCLRRLKTYIRSSNGQERLSNLALLSIERKYDIDAAKVIDEFDAGASLRGRRLQLQ